MVVLSLGWLMAGNIHAGTPRLEIDWSTLLLSEAVDDRLQRARDLIHEGRLDLAKDELEELLREDPDSTAVRRLYAQYHLSKGYRGVDNYEPASLRRAVDLLEQAVALQPGEAETYVLQGFVFRLMGGYREARVALEKAERIGTNDPWLHLNWGALLFKERRYEQAARRFRRVLADDAAEPSHRSVAHYGLVSYFNALGRLDETDKVHRSIIEESPERALSHVLYAGFLMCGRDDYEEAILHAKQARELENDFGATVVLGAALYRKWSVQVADGDLEQADVIFGQAYGLVGPYPANTLLVACQSYANVDQVLAAMQATGKGERFSPMQAVMMAAEAEEPMHLVPGVFAMTVVATGRHGDRGEVYLNSKEDYRDQLNLTVTMTAEALEAFKTRHGADPEVMLQGKAIEVGGYAGRQKVVFSTNGVPTGKYYYQTHVRVEDPEAIRFDVE